MAEPPTMVCYSRGAIDSLIDKLTAVKETHPKVDSLLKDLVSLREDLVNKFARGRATHKQVKIWMKQNRQLVYDIEDWVELKLAKTKEMNESDTDFEEQIDEFNAKIKEARVRSERYDLLHKVPTSDADCQDAAPCKTAVDSRPLWEKKGILVGIDGPRKKIEEHLKDSQMKRKVVSILGTGGLGKTTLATKVYEEISGQFECYAFVTVGRNSSTTALMDVFLQVNQELVPHNSRASLNEQEAIPLLWEFLKNKSYFIFIDDIRDTQAWTVMNCALPNNDLGSRILTTTRLKDVAMSCSARPSDFIYEMEGLGKDDSRWLLLNTIHSLTDDESANFAKYCDGILNKCCGLPLAIIVTAGLLAKKPVDFEPLGKDEESDEMENVLDICFADLALPVKACFLYLSTFPENYSIKKDSLIRKWVAEGFIPKIGQESMLETGENYFNELICRKLIRPVFDDYNNDQAVLCTVHPLIHGFIESLSRQEDFHTSAAELISGPVRYGTIRRFSVDCSRRESDEADMLKSSAVHLSKMRSLMVFGEAGSVLDFAAFKYLRVLDLEDTNSLDDKQVASIIFLHLLKYLGLVGTNVTKLPREIMSLEHLTALDIRRTGVRNLPAFENKKLVSLFAPVLTIPPRGIWGMEELEELSEVLVGRDVLLNLDGSHADDVAQLVNKSRHLRVLRIKFGYLVETELDGIKHFLKEVGKSKLQSLSLDGYPWALADLLVHAQDLRKFELKMADCLQLVPAEIPLTELQALTHMHIQVKVVEKQGICALGNLRRLILLKLFSENGTQERLSISSKDGFPCLAVFWFSSYFYGMGLQFEAGAMPHLRRLKIEFNARKTVFAYPKFDFGIEHLCCLAQVHAIIRCNNATDSEVKAAETAIRDQVSRFPYNPFPTHGVGPRNKEATKDVDRSSSIDIRISILREYSTHLPCTARERTPNREGIKEQRSNRRAGEGIPISCRCGSSGTRAAPAYCKQITDLQCRNCWPSTELRAKHKMDLQSLTLTKQPLRTLHFFMLAMFRYLKRFASYIQSKRVLLALLIVLVVAPGVILFVTDGLHRKHVQEFLNYAKFVLWWVSLGVASSIGLGSGLHTFVLYLGPHIALFTIKAVQCGRVDLKMAPYDTIQLKAGPSWLDKKCSEFGPPVYPTSAHSVRIPVFDLLPQIQLEAVLWGIGTALGELPPYFISRAARLSGSEAKAVKELDSVASKEDGQVASTVNQTKRWLLSHAQHLNFFTILILASVPNPLFDLAGIMCGQFGVPFWEFFFATMIGKAIIKTHIQTLFIVSLCNNQLLYLIEKELIWIFGHIPGFSATLPSVIAKLHAAKEKYLSPPSPVSPSSQMEDKSWNFSFTLVWNSIVWLVLVNFFIKIITSTAQDYLKKQQDTEMELLTDSSPSALSETN